MYKLADVQGVLSKVGPTLRKLASERDSLLEELNAVQAKLAEYESRDKVEKIARDLKDKGSFAGMSLDQRIEYVQKRASVDPKVLPALEEASKIMAKDGSFGELAEKTASSGGGDPREKFEAALLSI